MDRNVILAILAIVLVIIVGFFIFANPTSANGKTNTQLNFLSQSTIHNGDKVIFELKDVTGKALEDQNVTIEYVKSSGNTENYKVVTDKDGKGFLAISGEDAGNYDITLTFNGTDKYNACTAKQTMTLESGDSTAAKENTAEKSTANTVMYNNATSSSSNSSASTSSSSSSSSGSGSGSTSTIVKEDPSKQFVAQLYYDANLDVYYDDFGVVRGGPHDGEEIADLWNSFYHYRSGGSTQSSASASSTS